jgi:hypothetical protein
MIADQVPGRGSDLGDYLPEELPDLVPLASIKRMMRPAS